MSIVKKIKKTGRKIKRAGTKTVGAVAMVALTPVAVVCAVRKATKDD